MASIQGNFEWIRHVVVTLFLLEPATSEAASWIYKQGSEQLTDKQYSYAAGFAFDYQYNNDFTVSFTCTEGRVRFEINVDTLINSKGEEFQFAYRVDKREARQIKMRTFSNQNQGAYTYDNVARTAKDILGGTQMFVRAITWNNDYLDANLSLSGSDAAIKRVFTDCGVALDSSQEVTPTYSLGDFTSSFKKLTPAQQQQVLKELGHIMSKY